MVLIKEVLATFIATIAFGVLFNIHGKNLFFAGIGGALGWLVYKIGLYFGLSVILSMFFSAIAFSAYSEIYARILKTPVTTIVVCALIPLVPGGGMYNTMYEAIKGDALSTWNQAIMTISSSGALALGVLFVSTITRLINNRKKQYTHGSLNPKNILLFKKLKNKSNIDFHTKK